LAALFFSVILAGCGAPGKIKNNLSPSTSNSRLVLAYDTGYEATRGISVKWYDSLKAGVYTAYLENEGGTLYKGPELCVSRKMGVDKNGGTDLGPSDGGLWIPKPGSTEKPRFWFIFNAKLSDDAYSYNKLGVAGGVTMDLIFAAYKGDLEFWIPIEDETFMSKIVLKPVAPRQTGKADGQ
jgi:hypothetical protein